MDTDHRKASGAYYTPDDIAQALVQWAVRHSDDRLLDPSCGDGRFLALHHHSAGVEQDPEAVSSAWTRAPGAMIHEGDFFSWARETVDRFECAAGNPPFIRYQSFAGPVRKRALAVCADLGAGFSGLSSSWAPFLVATASLLKPGGRMAFVVPAEVGHAPYAAPLLKYLTSNFGVVHLIAVREKMFPKLSEDCWLLFSDVFGSPASKVRLTALDRFSFSTAPPAQFTSIPLAELKRWNWRLRPFLLPSGVRDAYEEAASSPGTRRLGDVARVGIGYVTGDNDFFHLRPSEAGEKSIPSDLLQPAVRNGRMLPEKAVTPATVQQWIDHDDPVLLLRIRPGQEVPPTVQRYLDGPSGRQARGAYKCRNRKPWYVVPDVRIPDAFLSYMSGETPALVSNEAGCVCTNSVHAVALTGKMPMGELRRRWDTPIARLSCELEGHPLGGGMLKIEPREAASTLLPESSIPPDQQALVEEGISLMRQWRHYA